MDLIFIIGAGKEFESYQASPEVVSSSHVFIL